jgi:betaine lipid synthase
MHVPKPVVGWSLAAIALALLLLALTPYVCTPLRFIWNCFVKPLTKGDAPEQKDRLDSFYAGQADVYDTTRTHLLKGRETMLQLLASHLKAQPVPSSSSEMNKPKIWVDIGGGTGWNIEKM